MKASITLNASSPHVVTFYPEGSAEQKLLEIFDTEDGCRPTLRLHRDSDRCAYYGAERLISHLTITLEKLPPKTP